ncbi:MAG: hypothetical protein WC879_14200 [Melioribacteraceae bacterium]
MNVERLHHIITVLETEMSGKSTSSNLQNLISSLQNVVNSPQASYQQNLSTSIKTFYSSVTNVSSDNFSPTWRQILSEIGAVPIFGRELKQNVENIIARNQMTPAVALEELKVLQKEIESFETALKNTISAFRQFKIGDETLAPGECEIGILIPRKEVKNQLLDFANELDEMGFILNTFAEVATGKKDELIIRNISSSELLVYLNAFAPYAACLAFAIERIVSLYKQLLEIRKLRSELRTQGVPDNATTGVDNHANQIMENGMEKLANEIIKQFYKGKDDGRKNELTNAVRISLNKLANRVDHGFNLEVRIQPLKLQDDKSDSEIKKAETIIQKAFANMQFLKLEGQPILKLPEALHKEKEKKDRKEVKDKKDKKEII